MTDWSRATYLDLTSWNATKYDSTSTVEEAYGLKAEEISPAANDDSIVVGFVVPRANDPSQLLSSSWGERQEVLTKLEGDGTLWTTYGAESALHQATVAAIESAGGKVDDSALSSAATRTVWAELDADAFEALFGQKLLVAERDNDGNATALYWNGALDPGDLAIEGLVVTQRLGAAEDDLSGGRDVELAQGPQGEGNGASADASGAAFANALANFYKFPLQTSAAVTATVALIESGIGAALPGDAEFEGTLNAYLQSVGLPGGTSAYEVSAGNQRSEYNENLAGERSLDVGVVGVINPFSKIGLYDAPTVYGSLQLAIFDDTNDPAVLSNSFSDLMRPAPDSPFAAAWDELYIDAALSNLAIFSASGDGGSGNQIANGLPNIDYTVSSPYTTVVGGTSISTTTQAEDDATLRTVMDAVKAEERGALWALIAGGLTIAPKDAAANTFIVETVWNEYTLRGDEITGLYSNVASTGGVDERQDVPEYQTDFGLAPTVDGVPTETGRGVPDVSALAGGNYSYNVPSGDLSKTVASGGTSASAPLWAALFQQLETIFAAQKLPSLGYSTDLLYQAAVITPAAFRDVQFGDNRSTFYEAEEGRFVTVTGQGKEAVTHSVNVTSYGYDAAEGFDFATGLGTPNGTILTESLLAIAHSELYFDTPAVLEETSEEGWRAGTDQIVSIQISALDSSCGTLSVDGERTGFSTYATERFAWTSRLAEQSLEKDFSADLLKMYDGASQGELFQIALDECDTLAVKVGGEKTVALQGALSKDFGFVDFFSDNATLRVARNVAVAETEHAQDDVGFTVNLRQMVGAEVKLQVYAVDDFAGTIDGLAPGDKGYAAAARANAYHTVDGATALTGLGMGEFASQEYVGVDAGDLIAMRVMTHGKVYYGFAGANETVGGEPVSHLWNYGNNTWGFETAYGGGDRDYNDLIIGFDFINYVDDLLAA